MIYGRSLNIWPNKHIEGFLYFAKHMHMKPFFFYFLSTCLKIFKNGMHHTAICQKYRVKIKKLGLNPLSPYKHIERCLATYS